MQDVVVNWTNLDWLAIFMYLGGMILVGWYVSRKVRNSEDYLMAGRALSYPMVVATVAATWYGSGAVFGTAELAFGSGIAAFVVWCVPAHLGRIPLALWVAPRVRGVKENTIPALLGRLYARPVAILGAVLIVCYSSRLMDIVSVGIMGNTVTGLPNWVIGAVIVGVVICYSMFGGLWSVVMTDVLQFFLMTSLTLLLLPGVWTAVGGFEGLRTALPAGHFSPAGGMSVSQILVFFLLGFQVYADPAAYQRFGASNSAKTAKRAYLTCLLIWMAFDAVMTMLGLGARALYPELQGSKAFLTMAINAMPPFLTGGEMIDNVTEQDATWAPVPEKFEAGTQDAAGIYATAAAVAYVESVGIDVIEAREKALVAYCMEELGKLDFVTIIGHPNADMHHGVVSFNVNGIHPHDVASILDMDQVAIRAGHHCAQPLLTWLGVENLACCRASLAFYNDKGDVDKLVAGLNRVWSMFHGE